MNVCLKCGNQATGRFTPDLDIKGIAFCDTCKTDIHNDLMFSILTDDYAYFERKYLTKKSGKGKQVATIKNGSLENAGS